MGREESKVDLRWLSGYGRSVLSNRKVQMSTLGMVIGGYEDSTGIFDISKRKLVMDVDEMIYKKNDETTRKSGGELKG